MSCSRRLALFERCNPVARRVGGHWYAQSLPQWAMGRSGGDFSDPPIFAPSPSAHPTTPSTPLRALHLGAGHHHHQALGHHRPQRCSVGLAGAGVASYPQPPVPSQCSAACESGGSARSAVRAQSASGAVSSWPPRPPTKSVHQKTRVPSCSDVASRIPQPCGKHKPLRSMRARTLLDRQRRQPASPCVDVAFHYCQGT